VLLTPVGIKSALPKAKPYRLSDGKSLYLVVHPKGGKSFEFRYRRDGKLSAMVLGDTEHMGLKEARTERDRLRGLLAQGLDPKAQRRLKASDQRRQIVEARLEHLRQKAASQSRALTVRVVAEAWVVATGGSWTLKHAAQVSQSLTDHVYPVIGELPVADVRPAHILDLMQGLLGQGKVETGRRVHQRLDAIFEYAALTHELPGNPVAVARREIGKRVKSAKRDNPARHFPCVPQDEAPQLFKAMRCYVGSPITQALLWFVAMTACRTGEARFAVWSEIDLDAGIWSIPAKRMKAARDHVVPLAPRVVELLRSLKALGRDTQFVFPHPWRDDRPASENALLYVLAEIGYKDRMTGHGFRHLFSTLANEDPQWRADAIEASLAHKPSEAMRATYNHASYKEERRRLMNWWADEVLRMESGTSAKVVPIAQSVA